MGVYFSCLYEGYTLPEPVAAALIETAEDLLKEHGLAGGEVGLILVDDQYIRSLNKKYRDKDAPTDVLSFSYLEPNGSDRPTEEEFAVGDIYISTDRARAQAVDVGHNLESEIALLVVHGLLHLLGYDHEQEKEQEIMQGKERAILGRLDF